ncbi:hypothetical protein [Spirochaeta isovalerica]|uniref:Uncharacterized protein n=1 Tax=Spirochaeta isovalerica TaxID=150 RepID=A0A841RHP6_9SPIO|nr:hypothetical protein [Spirochaeta isovalerica]MBB6482058.1 hypothetical protein [Spirochaeta isovalerica]
MNKGICILIFTLFFLPLFTAAAEMIEPGDWFQTSSTAGDAPDVVMSIVEVTPHIIQLDSNNGWVGFAYYNETEDEYSGFFELLKDTGEQKKGWTNQVFRIRMVQDHKTLVLEGKNPSDERFTATFRLRKDF